MATYPAVTPPHGLGLDDLNTQPWCDCINDLNTRLALLDTRRGCRLRRAAVQSINTATTTSISWDTEDQDTDGYIAVTGTTVTVPAGLGGLYAITFAATGVTTTGRLFGNIAVTSALTGYPSEFRTVSAGVETLVSCAVTLPLLAGDSFVSRIFHTNGAAANFTAWLAFYRVGV